MDKKDLKKGTRIYYHGDMANEEGFGVITDRRTGGYGTVVDIKMNDDREINALSVAAFSDEYLGHGGTKFVTEEAYRDFRQVQIDKVEATLAQRNAKKSTLGLSEIEIRKLGTAYHKKRSTSAVELRCKGCWNWNPEDTWKRERTGGKDSYALICPNCDIWNKGDIESRPIKKSKTVSVRSFFKGVPGRGVDY